MPDDNEKTQAEKLKKADELIRNVAIAMFTTRDVETDRLYARPMHQEGGIDDGCVYFFTYDKSHKVDEFRDEPQVNCAFADTGGNQYVSVAGRASLTHDRQLMEQKWDPKLKAWFADGIDTDGIALIRVRAEELRYWDARNQLMIHAYGVVKAAVTGEPVKDAGEMETVKL